MTYPNDTHISPHLMWLEVRCPCGCPMPTTVRANFVKLGPKFERVRSLVGGPLVISKGGAFRCPRYNKSIGGARYSRHMYGDALDCHSMTKQPEVIYHAAEKVPGLNGIGIYDTFCHFDQRTTTARWDERTK